MDPSQRRFPPIYGQYGEPLTEDSVGRHARQAHAAHVEAVRNPHDESLAIDAVEANRHFAAQLQLVSEDVKGRDGRISMNDKEGFRDGLIPTGARGGEDGMAAWKDDQFNTIHHAAEGKGISDKDLGRLDQEYQDGLAAEIGKESIEMPEDADRSSLGHNKGRPGFFRGL